MARAYFDNPFAPAPLEPGAIQLARLHKQRTSPLASLSQTIQEPFVTDVIVPGISRIRDEIRLSGERDEIEEQAQAKRAAAAQAMQQAAAAEQQGLEAEIAYGVGGVNVPMVSYGGKGSEISRLASGVTGLTQPMPYRVPGALGAKYGRDDAALAEGAMGLAGSSRAATSSSGLRAAQMFEDAYAEFKAGRVRPGSTTQEDLSRLQKISASLRERGLGDIVAEIVQGGTAEEAFMAAGQQLQQTQQRRGEQEATVEATQRFERALAGDLPQMAAAEQAVAEQALTPMMVNGRPGVRTRGYEGDKEQGRIDAIATRAYRRALDDGKSREESVAIGLAAAQAAQPEAVAAQEAQEAQAIQRPGFIEEANRLREQATALEAEATGIEATPVYRDFGSHATAFLDALDSGDVAKQNALMASVGGSTDYQPYGKGAVGKAMGKDASMRARKDLLDLKKKYLEAQRREKTGLKFIAARKPAPKAKRTGGGGGGKSNVVILSVMAKLQAGKEVSTADRKALARWTDIPAEDVDMVTTDPDTWGILSTKLSGRRSISKGDRIIARQPSAKTATAQAIRTKEREAAETARKAKATADKTEKKRLEKKADRLRAEALTLRANEAARKEAVRKAEAARKALAAKNKPIRDRVIRLEQSADALDINIADPTISDSDKEKDKARLKRIEKKIVELELGLLVPPDVE